MKLYMIPACPFVHRVLLACDVRQIGSELIQRIEIDLNNPPAQMLSINPTGSVPTLEFDDGRGFHESLVIMEFLDSLSATGPKIYGSTPRSVAETKVFWEAVNSKILSPVQQAIYSFGNVNTLKQAREKLNTGWSWLNNELTRRGEKFFGGAEMNAIDIALAPFLARLHYVSDVHPMIELPEANSPSRLYLEHVRQRCARSQVFPAESIMRETTLKFAHPHPLFVDVQTAPRDLIDNPQAAVNAAGELLSAWTVERDQHGYCLKMALSFKSHAEAVEKLKWLHDAQEICDHHTSFKVIDFTNIEITLVTHEPRWGVTQKDLTMAKLLQQYFTKGQLP